MIATILIYLLVALLALVFICGYVRYYSAPKPIEPVVRDAEAWQAKREALEEQYGLLTREIIFTHYQDDVSDNAFVFDDSEVLLLMGRPIAYDKIERATLEFAGEYVLKIWVEGIEGHYLTQSTDNGSAANELKAELDRIIALHTSAE
ncbi:MAG: hypothetical protein IJ816_05145 [Alloprevotella sp.]|nr:hypothetical protein [Alloprevotella sp.]